MSAQFSPDGRWVAYTSDESGHPEVYVRPFVADSNSRSSGAGGKWLISENGGSHPQWREDGRCCITTTRPGGCSPSKLARVQDFSIRAGPLYRHIEQARTPEQVRAALHVRVQLAACRFHRGVALKENNRRVLLPITVADEGKPFGLRME